MSDAYSRFQARKAFVESQAKLMGGTRPNAHSAFVFADEETTELFYSELADYDEAAALQLRGFRRVEQAAAVQALRDECKPRNNVGYQLIHNYYRNTIDRARWFSIGFIACAVAIVVFLGVSNHG